MVEYVEGLHEVQDKVYDTPTVLVAGQVRERVFVFCALIKYNCVGVFVCRCECV